LDLEVVDVAARAVRAHVGSRRGEAA